MGAAGVQRRGQGKLWEEVTSELTLADSEVQ